MFKFELSLDDTTSPAELRYASRVLSALLNAHGAVADVPPAAPVAPEPPAAVPEPVKPPRRQRTTKDPAEAYVAAGGTMPADQPAPLPDAPPADDEPTKPDEVEPASPPPADTAALVKQLREKTLAMASGVVWLRAQLAKYNATGMSMLTTEQLAEVIATPGTGEAAA